MTSKDGATKLVGSLEVRVGKVPLVLLPERAVWQPSTHSLFVADTHLGKEAAFRAASIPIPDVTRDDLARLTRAVHATSAARLFVLGDLLHGRHGHADFLSTEFQRWRSSHGQLEITLVRGNHDLRSGDPPRSWNIRCQDFVDLGDLHLRHAPRLPARIPTLTGHLHPKFRLRHGHESLNLACFLRKGNVMVLPAFGSFIDGQLIRTAVDQVFVVAGEEVLEVRG